MFRLAGFPKICPDRGMCVKAEPPVGGGAVQGVEVHRIMNVGGVGDGLGEEDSSSSQDTAAAVSRSSTVTSEGLRSGNWPHHL